MRAITHHTPWLVVVFLALIWAALPAVADTPTERQLSADRDLIGLTWGTDGISVAALETGGRTEWRQLAPDAPSRRAPVAAPSAGEPPRVEIRSEGPRAEVALDGRPILATDFEALGRPALAPDGRWLVLSRAPLGAGTADLGELWRYDIAADRWTRLTYNNLEETSPAISPDGTQIAFLRAGALWTRPSTPDAPREVPPLPPPDLAQSPPRQVAAPEALTPPATIRVLHVEENTCRPGVPVGQVDVVPLEEYVPRVLRTETIVSSWTDAALKANSIAERSYAWALILNPKYPGADYDIKDWTQDQAYCECWWTGGQQRCGLDDPWLARAVQLTRETAGHYIAYNGTVVRAYYGADNSSPTTAIPGSPVFQAVDDPPSFGSKRSGHGWGMGQWNSERWGREGWSDIQILRHFYRNTTVEQGAGTDAPPLFAFDTPWPGRYLAGSGLLVTANATSASRPVTAVEFRAGWPWSLGGSRGGWRVTDTLAADDWRALLDLSPLPDLPAQGELEALRVAGTAYDGDGRITLQPLMLSGIDRQPPTLSARLAATAGQTATLTISAADAGPSGVRGVGWSRGWVLQENRFAPTGVALDDPAATDGRAIERRAGRDAAGTLYRAAFEGLPPGDLYRAWFRLRASATTDPGELAVLDVVDSGGGRTLGIKRLRSLDFRRAGAYQEFFVDFDYRDYDGHTVPNGSLEFRLRWLGGVDLVLDRVLVTTWPRPTGSSLAVPLAAGETAILKAADVAGNVSTDVVVTRPSAPPPTPTATPGPLHPQLFVPLMTREWRDPNSYPAP